MSFIKNTLQTIRGIEQLTLVSHTLFLIVFIFIIKLDWMDEGMGFPFIFVALLIFLSDRQYAQNKWLWFCFFALLALHVINDFYGPANHHFLLMFMSLLMFQGWYQSPETRLAFLQENARLIMILVLGFVSLQKFAAPTYMNGDFFSYMLMRGNFFTPIPILHPDYADWVALNLKVIKEVKAMNPYQGETCLPIQVRHQEFFSWIGQGLSYFVLFVETLTMLIVLLVRNKKIVHSSIIALVICILLARPECGFLSALCGLGLAQCPAELKSHRVAYLFLITLFSALILFNLVYY